MVDWPVADATPVKPLIVGALHANVVPIGTILEAVGVTEKVTFAQVVAVNAAICASGLIVTVTVNVVPDPQARVLGVTT
jgi:hypothetical protein